MQSVNITGQKRELGGHHTNDRLRKDGWIPGVIYGHKETPELVALSKHDLLIAIEGLAHVVTLQVDGRDTQYLLKEVQYDHLMKEPMHVDLMRVDPNERVQVHVALEMRGVPIGVREGGDMYQGRSDISIECPLVAIPHSVRVNIGHLKIDDTIHVSDLELPEGVVALDDANEVVVSVRTKRAETAPVAEEAVEGGSAEPEVIGRGKEEDEGEA